MENQQEYCKSLDYKFIKFHSENQHVYNRFETICLIAIAKGKTKIGAKQVIEHIRWKEWLKTDGEDFKINNSYTSRYVRMFQRQYPHHADKFETRKLRS